MTTSSEVLLTKSVRWPDRRRGPWLIDISLGVVADRVEVVDFRVRADRGAPLAVTSTGLLRTVPLRELAEEATTEAVARLKRQLGEHRTPRQRAKDTRKAITPALKGVALAETLPDPESLPDDASLAERAEAFLARVPEEGPRRGKPPTYGPEWWVKVANVYTDAYRAGKRPARAVEDHFHVSPRTASGWVRRCRELGLLGATKQGKAGGVSTPRTKEGK